MSKAKGMIKFLVGLASGVAVALGVYFAASTDVNWIAYLKDTIIPSAVMVLTNVAGICGAGYPFAKTLLTAASSFLSATKTVDSAVAMNEETQAKLLAMQNTIADLTVQIDNLMKITKIGFCNQSELVAKGSADAINKVGAENERASEEV